MRSILDPKFKYVPSTATDIRKTFARVRKEMGLKEKEEKRGEVVPIVRKK